MDVKRPPDECRRRWTRWVPVVLVLGVVVGLVLMWRSPAMSRWLSPLALGQLGRDLLASPLGPLAVLGAYVLAVALAMPMSVMATMGVLVFGPWQGLAYSLCGMVSGAVVTYGVGRWGGPPMLARLSDARVEALAQQLRHKGLWAIILVRVLPVAPFLLVNLTAGALRVRLRDFVFGSIIGMLPGTIVLSLFMDRLTAAWLSPGPGTYIGLAVGVAVVLVTAWWTRRRLMAVAARESAQG